MSTTDIQLSATARERLPAHVAIIMDGNGRWAKQRGLSRSQGHEAGVESARGVVTLARTLGIGHLTLYTFSKENWSRPKEEIAFLFRLLSDFLTRELPTLLRRDIRLNVLGDISALPLAARQVLKRAMGKTERCSSMTVNLALNYSARDEIIQACRSLAASTSTPGEITEERFAQALFTAGQPDPDLIIRTSGEYRLSNYLLFQAAYSELYFTDTLWPDFDDQAFLAALENYAARQRRFGKTGEQVT